MRRRKPADDGAGERALQRRPALDRRDPRTQAYVAVNELAFKREEIGLNQVEAKVRLTIWHHPARPGEHRHRIDAGEVDP
jgi:hypothetical protein